MIDGDVTFSLNEVLGGVAFLITTGIAIRRLEYFVKDKTKDEKSEIYRRLGCLEKQNSATKTEINNLSKDYANLRDGCKTIEARVDDNVRTVERTHGNVIMLMKLVKKQ